MKFWHYQDPEVDQRAWLRGYKMKTRRMSKCPAYLTVQVSVSRILKVLSLEMVSREAPDSSNSTPRRFFLEIFSFFFSSLASLE